MPAPRPIVKTALCSSGFKPHRHNTPQNDGSSKFRPYDTTNETSKRSIRPADDIHETERCAFYYYSKVHFIGTVALVLACTTHFSICASYRTSHTHTHIYVTLLTIALVLKKPRNPSRLILTFHMFCRRAWRS